MGVGSEFGAFLGLLVGSSAKSVARSQSPRMGPVMPGLVLGPC